MKYTEIKDRYGIYRAGQIIPDKKADTRNNGGTIMSIKREGRGAFRVVTDRDDDGRQVFTML